MKGTFEFTGKTGTKIRLECEYTKTVEREIIWSDGYEIPGKLEIRERGEMVAYADGKKVDECDNENFFQLVDHEGVKKIWGLCIAFANPDTAEEYEAWLADLMEQGTTDEAKAFEAGEVEAEKEAEKERARKVIAKAESQKDIPSKEEAQARIKAWNDIQNEGGEGYVPRIITREEYEAAKKLLNA